MPQTAPVFGERLPGIVYRDRPGAYAVIVASDGSLAVVVGKDGRHYLPGGGIESGERLEDALIREIREECGSHARILGPVGTATQYVAAGAEGHFSIRATYFRVELLEPTSTKPEHELVWMSSRDRRELARASDAWALGEVRRSVRPGGAPPRRHGFAGLRS